MSECVSDCVCVCVCVFCEWYKENCFSIYLIIECGIMSLEWYPQVRGLECIWGQGSATSVAVLIRTFFP